MNNLELVTLTQDDTSPIGKERIFISYAYQDQELAVSKAKYILSLYDCAVCYIDHSRYRNIDPLEAQEAISNVDVFIPIVTKYYLDNDCFELKHLFSYAKKKHMNIMPLVQSNDLAESFNNRCGNIQFIEDCDTNNSLKQTEESIKEYFQFLKPSKDDSLLIEKVRKSFVNKIFLSYRKKDKQLLKQIIDVINSDTSNLYDVGLWYDENLSVGKKYDPEIDKKIKEANIFVLLVTNNIFDKDNYVLANELPLAREFHKTIIPVYIDDYDKDLYNQYFNDLPNPIPLKDLTDEITKYLKPVKRDAYTSNLIGLGYLYGWGVFKNPNKAKTIFSKYPFDRDNNESLYKYYLKYEPDELEAINSCISIVCVYDLANSKDKLEKSLFDYLNSFLDIIKSKLDKSLLIKIEDVKHISNFLDIIFAHSKKHEIDNSFIFETKQLCYRCIDLFSLEYEDYPFLYESINEELKYLYENDRFNYTFKDLNSDIETNLNQDLEMGYAVLSRNSLSIQFARQIGEYHKPDAMDNYLYSIYHQINENTHTLELTVSCMYIAKNMLSSIKQVNKIDENDIETFIRNVNILDTDKNLTYQEDVYYYYIKILLESKYSYINIDHQVDWVNYIYHKYKLKNRIILKGSMQLALKYFLYHKEYTKALRAELNLIKMDR